jgi:hypothetical protein
MIGKLMIGAGLFTLGYVLGKAVGRAEAEMGRRLGYEGDGRVLDGVKQTGEDAEFHQSAHRKTEARPGPA